MPDTYRFVVPEWILHRWIRVAYLIINFRAKDLAKVISVAPDERFHKTVDEHLRAYVENGVMPPEAIRPAILNMADDYLAGREMTLRAGDYIAIQGFVKGLKH